MPSYTFDIGEKARAAVRFIGHVRSELQRAFVREREANKLTQQAIAVKLGVNRSVINRQLTGIENLTVRSVAELAWAMGYEPDFSLLKRERPNYFVANDENRPRIVAAKTFTSSNSELALAL